MTTDFVSIKCSFDGEIHRFGMNRETVNLVAVMEKVKSTFFSSATPVDLNLFVQGTTVPMTDESLRAVAKDAQLIRVRVEVAAEKEPEYELVQLEMDNKTEEKSSLDDKMISPDAGEPVAVSAQKKSCRGKGGRMERAACKMDKLKWKAEREAAFAEKVRHMHLHREEIKRKLEARVEQLGQKADRLRQKASHVAVKLEQTLEKIAKVTERLTTMPKRWQDWQERMEKRRAGKKAWASKFCAPEHKQARMEHKRMCAERKAQWTRLASSWSETVPENITCIIADGNNMRGGGPGRHDKQQVVARIARTLNSIRSVPKRICFFDGVGVAHEERGIEVMFSGDRTADDVIVEMVTAKNEDARNVLVVTADRGLALRLLDLGAYVMRNKVFHSFAASAVEAVTPDVHNEVTVM